MLRTESPFEVVSIESRKGMVGIIRMKMIFEDGKPKEIVYEILVRKLENLNDVLAPMALASS